MSGKIYASIILFVFLLTLISCAAKEDSFKKPDTPKKDNSSELLKQKSFLASDARYKELTKFQNEIKEKNSYILGTTKTAEILKESPAFENIELTLEVTEENEKYVDVLMLQYAFFETQLDCGNLDVSNLSHDEQIILREKCFELVEEANVWSKECVMIIKENPRQEEFFIFDLFRTLKQNTEKFAIEKLPKDFEREFYENYEITKSEMNAFKINTEGAKPISDKYLKKIEAIKTEYENGNIDAYKAYCDTEFEWEAFLLALSKIPVN